MKILDFKSFGKLNELFTYTYSDDYDGKHFLLYESKLWIFTEDEYSDENVYEEINEAIGEEILTGDMHDDMVTISEEYPYILIGYIDDDIIINGNKNYRVSSISPDLKKLKNELNREIRIDYSYGTYLDKESSFYEDIQDLKSATFYHGTCLKYVDSIMNKGITPSDDKTNFSKVKHYDKIFVTTNLEKALFHAFTAAKNTESFPIILEVKIPDINKLVIDYDIAIDLYGSQHELTDELGYSDVYMQTGGINRSSKNILSSKNIDLAKKLGIFGYLGRIPASHIYIINKFCTSESNDKNYRMINLSNNKVNFKI